MRTDILMLRPYDVEEILVALYEVDYILADQYDIDEGPMPALRRAIEILDPSPVDDEEQHEEE